MLGRVSILFVTACSLTATAGADSISLQHNPSLATPKQIFKLTMKSNTASPAVIGDLGRGFSTAERRSLLQVKDREFFGDRVSHGKLVTSEPGLNLNFLGNTRPEGSLDTFTRQIWRFLFHRAPTGARGRREQAGGR
jgi:hypothetical protein